MQQQDLSGAMLLYDDINRKGFEGDMVLNGFSEFIRNLLVCKDERSAELLEAVEGFREKYISTAKNIPAAYLVSALNILNETEINYKAARNKRLHVELALIRLCYLQQAIELTSDLNTYQEGITKKKLVEKTKPVAFRKIEPIEISRQVAVRNEDKAKLLIEIQVKEESFVYNDEDGKAQATGNGQLVREDSLGATGKQQPTTGSPTPAPKLAALDKIRSQMRGNGNAENGNVAKPILLEELQQAWNEYASQLKKEKNPAGQNFEMAELRIQDANSFIALVSNNIQLRFIEQQGLKVSQFLREKLCNNQLQFYIVMQENTGSNSSAEAPLTSREQFQKMVEQYPLVRELKDRLRLELDY
jgi:DNA polymerase-3 subunit gamma/tau